MSRATFFGSYGSFKRAEEAAALVRATGREAIVQPFPVQGVWEGAEPATWWRVRVSERA